MTLGEKIYGLRIKKGISQEVFGEQLGVSRQSVSKWETDQSVPELDKIIAISELFGVSTDYLLKDEPPYETETEEEYPSHKKRRTFEYKSEKMVWGVPLVHIHFGKAKGIIAIGTVAQGVIAVGFLSAGVLTCGLLTAGLLAVGTIAAGLFSFGSFSVGVISFGAFSFGIFSLGAASFGEFSFGAFARGRQVAIGDVARGLVAIGVNETSNVVGEVYEDIAPIDIEAAKQAIEENVPDYWLFFKSWAKSMVGFMSL